MLSRAIRTACIVFVVLAVSPLFAGTIGLSWSPSPGARGYRVLWGSSPGVYSDTLDVGDTTSTVLTTVGDCANWYFAVTAYNFAGESGPSSEVNSWPRPDVTSTSPGSAIQGTQLTLTLDGTNFQSGVSVQIDNSDVLLDNVSAISCNQIQIAATVEPMASGVRPAEIGQFTMTVTNPGDLQDVQMFEVLVQPSRFDINTSDPSTEGRIDGMDVVSLARLFGSQDGDATYDPDTDFDGNGWVDGDDLAFLASSHGGCWNGSGWIASACP